MNRGVSPPRGALGRRVLLACLLRASPLGAEPSRPRVLFLGDQGHHRPAERFRDIEPVLRARGIDVKYTEAAADLNAATLASYDCLLIYANIEKITPEEESALLDYV